MTTASQRLDKIHKHLSGQSVVQYPTSSRHSKSDDDIVVVSARRTAICKARRGCFKDTLPCDLLSPVLEQVVKDAGIHREQVNDICVGNCNQPAAGAARSRTAQFYAGFPVTTTLSAVNRQCSSGLQAVMNVASHISMGVYDIGIGAGVESMTMKASREFEDGINNKLFEVDFATQCTIPMGNTSEIVAERYGVTREQQDRMAMQSHQKAARATAEGRFDAEIVPITTELEDKEGNSKQITVTKDDGIRPQTNMEALAKLKPAFQEVGSTTAGNSSQVSDGAAAVLLMKRSTARRLGCPVMGVIRAFKVVGCRPDEMGIGPALAIPQALKHAGLDIADIDIYEINEAFASQAHYSVAKLGIPMEKVNVNGGAIALGHPLGCTGARQIATLLHEMRKRGKRGYGVTSMCVGTGMGAAAVFEYEG